MNVVLTTEQIERQKDIDEKMLRVQALVKELGLENEISVVAIRQNRAEKDDYVVTLSNNDFVSFKSSDDKAAKYRAYRISKDGDKNREPNLKVTSLLQGTRIVQ